MTQCSQHIDHLTPPIGTSFFKWYVYHPNHASQDGELRLTSALSEELIVCRNETLDDGRQLSWYITMYKYCMGAIPTDPDFRKKGGKIMIVLVHHGTLKLPADLPWTLQIFRIYYDDDTAVTPYLQLPETHTGTPNSDGHGQYQIDFQMHMPLFLDEGSKSFIFNAEYKEVFVRPPGTYQRGREQLSGLVFTIGNRVGARVSTHQLIRGLTVLKCFDPSKRFRFSTFDNAGGGTQFYVISVGFGQDSYNRLDRLGIIMREFEVDLMDF